jgi:hypothetical protein
LKFQTFKPIKRNGTDGLTISSNKIVVTETEKPLFEIFVRLFDFKMKR